MSSAKSASMRLSRFGSRVRDAVDNLVAVDEFAIRSLKSIQETQDAAPTGISGLMLSPFRGRHDVEAAQKAVLGTFLQAARVMDTSIQKLINDAEFTIRELNELEEKLNVVEDIVQREKTVLSAKETEVLARIWTSLGGNRGQLNSYANHKDLLSNISVYRKRALLLVGKSLIQLQTMQGDLEVLRERVAEPGVVASAGDSIQPIPLEVHIQTISMGVSRLSESMARAKDRENS